MKTELVFVIHESIKASFTGELTFPQIVGRLIEVGVERYHADCCRQEKTFYFADGTSIVAATPCGSGPIAVDFSPSAVEAAVRQSQRNEHTYADFLQKIMAAGCVGYFVQITGRRALYFGRNGETHVELFPTAPGQ